MTARVTASAAHELFIALYNLGAPAEHVYGLEWAERLHRERPDLTDRARGWRPYAAVPAVRGTEHLVRLDWCVPVLKHFVQQDRVVILPSYFAQGHDAFDIGDTYYVGSCSECRSDVHNVMRKPHLGQQFNAIPVIRLKNLTELLQLPGFGPKTAQNGPKSPPSVTFFEPRRAPS